MQDPDRQVIGESARRTPSEESVERAYKIGLDELASLLHISEPAVLNRTVEVKGSEVILHYKGTLRS
jgi:DNA-binding Lrp family transcriptional regulator